MEEKKTKKVFEEPKVEILHFDKEDIITSSGVVRYLPNDFPDDNPDNWYV